MPVSMASTRYSWCGSLAAHSLLCSKESRNTHGESCSCRLPLKTPHPFFQQPNPSRTLVEKIELAIESSGLEWTYLRPGMFNSNTVAWWASQMRAGDVVRWPYLSVATAPIDARDIAAVAVRALCEDGHGRAEYVLTGPEPLTQAEQAKTIGPRAWAFVASRRDDTRGSRA